MPERIQLSRQNGWRMPFNTVNVTRGNGRKWGNPFPVGEEGPFGRLAPDQEGAVGFFRDMLHDSEMMLAARYPLHKDIQAELRGKNLACWCKLGSPCHGDVLLELANAPARNPVVSIKETTDASDRQPEETK